MGAAMKVITEQLKSDAPDLPKIAAAAQTIGTGAREQPSWFRVRQRTGVRRRYRRPARTGRTLPGSRHCRGQLGVESSNFSAAVASNDVAAIRVRFKVLAEVCCHLPQEFQG